MPRELKNLVIDEVSAVDSPANPGARVVLTKRDDYSTALADIKRRIDALADTTTTPTNDAPTAKKEDAMSLEDEVRKLIAPAAGDDDKITLRKRVSQMALDTGVTTVSKIAAEAIIEAKAREVQKRDGGSFEQAYASVLFDPANREVAAVLAH